ncbi:hypothetical protein M8C21_004848, partial [Ambrosia artemisiifolia]
MARISKTSPFRPREQPESRSNTEGEKQDEEEESSSSSSTTSSNNLEINTQDKKQEKAMGKRPVQAKKGKRKPTAYEMISGPERAKRFVTKRGRGKPVAYTARLWSKHHPWIDVPTQNQNAEQKPKSTQDKMQGKRQMQAKGNVNKRGRETSTAYTIRSPQKKVDMRVSTMFELPSGDPKLKEADEVFQSSETDSDEVCKRIKIERRDVDDDTDNDGRRAGTHGDLTSLGLEIV